MPAASPKKIYPDDPLFVAIEQLFFTSGPKEKIKGDLWRMYRDSLADDLEYRPQERADLFQNLCDLIDASSDLA